MAWTAGTTRQEPDRAASASWLSRLRSLFYRGYGLVLPFAVAFAVALSVTGYLQARGPASLGTAAPPGPASAPTFAQMMNLSPVPERATPGFTLTDQHGRPVSLASFRGKEVLLGFRSALHRGVPRHRPGADRRRA